MKIRFEWEPNDVESGRRVFRENSTGGRFIEYLIGYVSPKGKRTHYLLIEVETDGWSRSFKSKELLAFALNEGDFVPFRHVEIEKLASLERPASRVSELVEFEVLAPKERK